MLDRRNVPVSTPAPGSSRLDATAALIRPAWVQALLVLLLGLSIGLAFQGSRHLWDSDEGRYTDVAHNMVESGDWLVPRLNPHRPHFTKPPMTYWAIGASFRTFGNSVWAARLPNAIAFALTGLLVLGLARQLALPSPALAAAIWLTLLAPAAAANAVTTDTLLALFTTLAVFGFVRSGLVLRDAAARPGAIRLMWLGFALAFLTKGPPGLLPLAAIVAFVAWRRRGQLRSLLDPAGLAVFAIVGLGWYVALVWHSPDLLRYFVYQETLARVATDVHHRNAGWLGWLEVYGPTLLAGSLPWSAVFAVTRLRAGARKADVDEDLRRFLLLWFALPMAVFVAARSRLPLYVLPLFVPMALALAAWMPREFARAGRAWVAVAISALAVVALKFGAAQLHPDADAHRLSLELAAATDMQEIEEIVFVDTAVRYGLKHYLKLDIEQAESYPGALAPEGYSRAEPLCTELAERTRALVVAPASRMQPIEQAMLGCGARIEPAGTLRKWALFRVIPAAEADSAPAGPQPSAAVGSEPGHQQRDQASTVQM